MKKLLLYLFLIVVTDPYRDINYEEINVYETNYCSGYQCPDKVIRDPYMEEDKEDEYRDDKKSLVFSVDFLKD